MATLKKQTLKTPVGQFTRLGVPFSWNVAGQDIDLEADGYTVEAWVTDAAGATTGPEDCTVSGKTATYQLDTDDLDTETTGSGVQVVAVADNGTDRLISEIREIPVAAWPGSDGYTPD